MPAMYTLKRRPTTGWDHSVQQNLLPEKCPCSSYLLLEAVECSLHASCCTEGGPLILELLYLLQWHTPAMPRNASTRCLEKMVCIFITKMFMPTASQNAIATLMRF